MTLYAAAAAASRPIEIWPADFAGIGKIELLAGRAVNLRETLIGERNARAIEDDAARLHGNGARAKAARIFDLVQRHEDGDAVIAVDAHEGLHHAARRGGIERGDRLIGEQNLGALHKGAGDCRALLLAAGQGRGALARRLGNADPRPAPAWRACWSASGKRPSMPLTTGIWPSTPVSTLVRTDMRPTRLNCWKITPMLRRMLADVGGDLPAGLNCFGRRLGRR